MEGLDDAAVARLLPILSERARAKEELSGAFRPPQVGIVEQVGSNWHHFVVGRRGVGKSMLLLNVAESAVAKGQPVAYIDLETLRDNPYPDVLIRLLIELAGALQTTVAGAKGSGLKRLGVKRSLKKLQKRLRVLLAEPAEASHSLTEAQQRSRGRQLGFALRGGATGRAASAAANVGAEASSGSSSTTGREATFIRTKLEGLQAESVEFRHVLQRAVEVLGGTSALIVLDDFYFIRRDHQPDVLSYLQQVVKNLNIWLKIGAVEHRLNEFEDGDPPRGLQLTQDAGKVSMDVTLADFDHTKRFLESILSDICLDARVQLHDVVTDTARTRLVLASGGVPRDYLNLVQAALAKASRRSGEPNRPRNKITAEDVTLTAPDFLKQREEDLVVDARAEDVDRLRASLNEVLNFCLVHRKTNVFLVASRHLREDQWGRDIAALSDLRFFHRIGNTTVKSGDAAYVGVRYDAFALDLSSYSGQRVRTNEIEFWTTDGAQQMRAVGHVYTPPIAQALAADAPLAKKRTKKSDAVPDPAQMTIDDVDLFGDQHAAAADEGDVP